jgi:hypothetical protein
MEHPAIATGPLRATIAGCFNESELGDLCADLQVDYENLPGETKSDHVRELIAYLQRRNRLPELVTRCAQLRPLAQWTAEPSPAQVDAIVHTWLTDPLAFSDIVCERPMRQYQIAPARAIVDSVLNNRGLSFAVMMSRQAGKNELSGQLEAYLLCLFQRRGGSIVKASPTFRPQTVNSILRLTDRLSNPWTGGLWRRREGYIVQVGRARGLFFSAAAHSNTLGATASLLLECDEAQDVSPGKWDKDFVPMGASTNVTTVYWGTAWTSDTMLSQRMLHLQELERKDGVQRVFLAPCDAVAAEVPAYGEHVRKQVARLGRNHPIIRSQYYLETIDAEGGLFPASRRALVRGDHSRRHEPEPGHRYALLLDVAGEDEEAGDVVERSSLQNPRRDSTALTVVDVEVHYGRLPTYRAVDRRLWLGAKHASLYQQIIALARHWRATWVVVDATGVGAGLAGFLGKALGERVLPIVFGPRVKSQMGWDFLACIETGRFRDYASAELQADDAETRQFWYELESCQYAIRPGPARLMSWGVWEAVSYDGRIAYGHDDLLMSAALCAFLDQQEWPGTGESVVIHTQDVLESIDRGRW